jgi:hypothetical protein
MKKGINPSLLVEKLASIEDQCYVTLTRLEETDLIAVVMDVVS